MEHTFDDVFNAAPNLPAPLQGAATTATTGGTGLAASTAYFYKVTALGVSGESLGSNEVSVTTGLGATNSNTLSWSAVVGATGYRVYRGTAVGAESVYYAPGNVLTYVDTGAASTVGTVPTTNTAVSAMTPFPHTNVVGQTANKDGNYSSPVSAVRINVTAGAGTVTLTLLQGVN